MPADLGSWRGAGVQQLLLGRRPGHPCASSPAERARLRAPVHGRRRPGGPRRRDEARPRARLRPQLREVQTWAVVSASESCTAGRGQTGHDAPADARAPAAPAILLEAAGSEKLGRPLWRAASPGGACDEKRESPPRRPNRVSHPNNPPQVAPLSVVRQPRVDTTNRGVNGQDALRPSFRWLTVQSIPTPCCNLGGAEN
jgi:hypothetical protein